MAELPSVPPGYQRVEPGLGYTDSLQPFYRRVDDSGVSFGLFVTERHVNLMGICHGGALMTLADIAAAVSINHRLGERRLLPTINLSFDFQSPGKLGRWLHTVTDCVDVKKRFGFASGQILDGERRLLRFSGVFYLPGDAGQVPAGAARGLDLLTGPLDPGHGPPAGDP